MERLSLATSTKDIYIKKMPNKLAGIIFRTHKAKELAKKNNVPNHYQGEDTYRFDMTAIQAIKILTWAITHKMSVDSEVPMIVGDKSEEMKKERGNRNLS
jgi:hypothetical protein